MNYGKIEAKARDVKSTIYEIGGITGELSANIGEIKKCINEGDIYIEVFPEAENNGGAVGGIAGWAEGSISECINYGNIMDENIKEGDIKVSSIGGIIGERRDLALSKCINHGEIVCLNETKVGGIIGQDQNYKGNSSIENCYNTGNINAKEIVGGIIGQNGYKNETRLNIGLIKNSYNIGKVTGTSNVGGIAGLSITECSTIENSYYLVDSANVAYTTDEGDTSIAGAKTEKEMKESTFVDLLNQDNEEKIWIIDNENNGYPRLDI